MTGFEMYHGPSRAGMTFLVAASDASASSKARADYICDGVDDQVQINAAIAALPAGGGRVVLSEGTFLISDTISDQGKSNVALVGQGDSTIIKLADNTITVVALVQIELTNVSGWMLADFKYDGNRANQVQVLSSHAVHLDQVTNSIVKNVTFRDTVVTSLRIEASSENQVIGCRFFDDDDMAVFIAYGSHRNVVLGCYFEGGTEDAAIKIREVSHGNIIDGCTFFDGPSAAIQIVSGAAVACDRNIVSNCFMDGNETTPDSRTKYAVQGSLSGGTIKHTLVIGNTIINFNTGIALVGSEENIIGNNISDCDSGIHVSGDGTVIIGNQVNDIEGTGPDGAGILVTGHDNGVVNGNRVDSAKHGIDVNNSDYNTISGNQTTNSVSTGIRENGTSDNNLIEVNTTVNNAVQITKLGASSIVRNNLGHVTENSGTGSIDAAATTDVIAHGLDVTPTVADIYITLAEDPTNTPGAIWIDTIGAANFTVNCENVPGASNLDFGWRAVVL